MNHIEKALQLAEKYEKLGNKKLAKKFLDIAGRYEKFIEEARRMENEKKQKELYG